MHGMNSRSAYVNGFLAALLLSGCSGSCSPSYHQRPPVARGDLIATVRVVGPQPAPSFENLRLAVSVTNRGRGVWRAPITLLRVAQIAVDIEDGAGTRVDPVSPPVPGGAEQYEDVGPGEHIDLEVGLNAFATTVPPGRYTLAFGRDYAILHPTVTIEIGERTPVASSHDPGSPSLAAD